MIQQSWKDEVSLTIKLIAVLGSGDPEIICIFIKKKSKYIKMQNQYDSNDQVPKITTC